MQGKVPLAKELHMSAMPKSPTSRRRFLTSAAALGVAAAASPASMRFAIGQQAKIKLGLLLSYAGTYAPLSNNITDALKLRLAEAGDKLGGRPVEIVQLDDEADPAKAPANTTKLITGEKVDFLIGPVHSGVAMAMCKIAREEGTMTIVANAGANAVTRAMCAPNIFRTSFSNWQACAPMGKVMAELGHKSVVTMSWKYAAGQEMLEAFTDSFKARGGKVMKEILVPFPDVEFQAQLTEIASLKPDAVFVFFSGGGAVKYMKDYAATGLPATAPLFGPGFLTDGTLEGAGAAGEGIKTTLHYADDLDTPLNKGFRAAFRKASGRDADVFAVQGYDTGTLLIQALDAVKGDLGARKDLIAAMEKAEIASPRGTMTFSKAHNPIQNIYLREARGGSNRLLGVAERLVDDPATGCKVA
jgi:branched-chain amino acid transport system substrate-binding protein